MHELDRLTPGERLVIVRRRDKKNQTERASEYGMTRQAYAAWEANIDVPIPVIPVVGPLAPHEVAFLYRRRSGLTRTEVAVGVGKSPHWVTLMERGEVDCSPLMGYWEQ